MKKLSLILMAGLLVFIYTSCQQIFTYSALEWAQRDPSTLPLAQQISYAENALASGDQAAVESAYAALSSSSDPAVQALASQLAVSASGLDDAITDAITTMTFDPAIIGTISNAWLVDAEASMLAADSGGADITPEEYLTIAAALVILDAQANSNTITTSFPAAGDPVTGTNLQKAAYYAAAAGYTETELATMFGS